MPINHLRPRPAGSVTERLERHDRISGAAAQSGPQQRSVRGYGARHGSRHGRDLPAGPEDPRLVNLAALLAVDAAQSSYNAGAEVALATGATVDEIVGI